MDITRAIANLIMPPDGRPERTLTATANLLTILRIFNPYHKMDLAADLRNAGGQQRQSRSAFKRACATAAWPDALQ